MTAVPKPNHRRRVPKRVNRGKFSRETRMAVLERDNFQCQNCLGKAESIHHCVPKGRGGRGVYTNALTVCNDCHTQIHKDNSLLEYWIDVFTDRYGSSFYKDEFDL